MVVDRHRIQCGFGGWGKHADAFSGEGAGARRERAALPFTPPQSQVGFCGGGGASRFPLGKEGVLFGSFDGSQ